jgi:GTP-binding protein HflX
VTSPSHGPAHQETLTVQTGRKDLSLHPERAVLVAALLPGDDFGPEGPLAELERLAQTAGAEVVGKLIQKMPRYEASTYLGHGKTEELRLLAQERRADTIICDNDLTPAQIRNLERILNRKVIDRSELILDIFAIHARTRQAKLQVELAQMEYTMPRLTRLWQHLWRIEGGVGARGGPGEKQLEIDRRMVRKRISDLRDELKRIGERKEREVAARSEEFRISIVGYTNAGKSTLMNALTDAHMPADDRLFVTLDTRTRVWRLTRTDRALLSDTVGFIRRLPHHLVASFHATLEEASHADLLLHVVDISDEAPHSQVRAVNEVLEQIGAADTATLMVLNKIDRPHDEVELGMLRATYPFSVAVSALHGDGIEQLRELVLSYMNRELADVEIWSHCGNGRLIAMLAENGHILSQEYRDDYTRIVARVNRRYLGRIAALNGGQPARTLA